MFFGMFPHTVPRDRCQPEVLSQPRGWAPSRHMYATVDEAAERLRVHRSTIYKLMNDDPTFPSPHYVRRRCPRFRVSDLDRWMNVKAVRRDTDYVSPDLYEGKARGPRPRRRPRVAA